VVHLLAEVRESLFSKDSTLALQHSQPTLQWAPKALSLAVKQPPSNDEVKAVWSTPPLSHVSTQYGAQ
jgi:hypothetical protein